MHEFKTVKQFAERYPAFTESSLRYLIFESKVRKSPKGELPGNGMEVALRRIGRRIYILPQAFFEWIEMINAKGER